MRGVAKGSKRERSRFCGGFEAPTRGHVGFSPKPTEGLTLLTSWDIIETYPTMRTDLAAFGAGMGLIDLVYHAVVQHDPHPGLFDALSGALSMLRDPRLAPCAVLTVLWATLDETGHRPELHTDVRTGEALGERASYGFSARLGGTLTDEPGASVDREGGEVWRVRAATVSLLRALARAEPLAGAGEATISRATKLLCLYYKEVFRAEPLVLRTGRADGGRA